MTVASNTSFWAMFESTFAGIQICLEPLGCGLWIASVSGADNSDIELTDEITDAVVGTLNSAYIEMLGKIGAV